MSYRGSPYYEAAIDGGYRGEEAEQVAGMLEDGDRQCMEAMEAAKRERDEAAGCPDVRHGGRSAGRVLRPAG